MIIEVHRSAEMNGLGYNLKKLDQCKAEIIATKWIPKDASGEEIAAILQANTLNARVKKPYAHLNINPAIEDWENGLTVEKLAEISKEAVESLFPNVPYIIFVHKDIARWHAHAVCPCITRDGKLISDRFEWNRAMKVSRELEIKYNLERALEHTEERRVNRAEPIKYEDGDLSRKIGDVLALAMTYRFSRLGELNAFLNLYNCGFDQVDNDKKRGLSYYVLQDGQRMGRAIIATKIHGGALASIEKHLKNDSISENDLAKMRLKIERAINNAINFNEVKKNLERMNVRTVERINTEGKVLGITFVDDEHKIIANGSNIGREYSYANIMKRFQHEEPIQKISLFDSLPDQEPTASETEAFGQIPDLSPDIAGLIHVGQAVGSVNKRKKKWKLW